jgi:hypothetical protein
MSVMERHTCYLSGPGPSSPHPTPTFEPFENLRHLRHCLIALFSIAIEAKRTQAVKHPLIRDHDRQLVIYVIVCVMFVIVCLNPSPSRSIQLLKGRLSRGRASMSVIDKYFSLSEADQKTRLVEAIHRGMGAAVSRTPPERRRVHADRPDSGMVQKRSILGNTGSISAGAGRFTRCGWPL